MGIIDRFFRNRSPRATGPLFAQDFGIAYMAKNGMEEYTIRLSVPLSSDVPLVHGESRLGPTVTMAGQVDGQTYIMTMLLPLPKDSLRMLFYPPTSGELALVVRLHPDTLTASTGERYRPLQVTATTLEAGNGTHSDLSGFTRDLAAAKKHLGNNERTEAKSLLEKLCRLAPEDVPQLAGEANWLLGLLVVDTIRANVDRFIAKHGNSVNEADVRKLYNGIDEGLNCLRRVTQILPSDNDLHQKAAFLGAEECLNMGLPLQDKETLELAGMFLRSLSPSHPHAADMLAQYQAGVARSAGR